MSGAMGGRVLAVAAAFAAITGLLGVADAGVAQAETQDPSSCGYGDRDRATEIADEGAFREAGRVQSNGTLSNAEITLRYSDQYSCAWALVEPSNGPADVWIERETATGEPERLGSRYAGDGTTHTGTYDVSTQAVRACGNAYDGDDTSGVTGSVSVGASGVTAGASGNVERKYSRAGEVCTDWAYPEALAATS